MIDELAAYIIAGVVLDADERCPNCGSEPHDDTVHRDGCPRVDTCGQYGPPWLAPPWHPEDPPLHPRANGESLAAWTTRAADPWRAGLNRHRRDHTETVATKPRVSSEGGEN